MSRRPSLRIALLLALWVAMSATAIVLLAAEQRDSRQNIEERFALRATIAARFVSTYVGDAVRRESVQAARHLSGRDVSGAEFARVVTDADFSAALLLDADGRALRVFPDKPGLVGADMASRYTHLASAVTGRVTVSNVVPSAAAGLPIVAFAVPFDTPQGRRVYSGAQEIGLTAAGAYLRNAVTVPGSRLYLIDAEDKVIAKNEQRPPGVRPLADLDPVLARSVERSAEGDYELDGEAQRYVSGPIEGTPWRVVVAAPAPALFASIDGASTWLPWIVVVAFLLVSLVAGGLVLRVVDARSRLAEMNRRLEEIVRVDPLTGLANRRGLDEHLSRTVSASRRHGDPLAVLVIDVDHFKRINDTHGHAAGDIVLAGLGHMMRDVLRTEDMLGRWGGEEFLAVLPGTGLEPAVALAERIRATIAGTRFDLPGGAELSMTVSIGVSAGVGTPVDDRITAADRALYAAKDAGRDRVIAAGPAATVT